MKGKDLLAGVKIDEQRHRNKLLDLKESIDRRKKIIESQKKNLACEQEQFKELSEMTTDEYKKKYL